MCITLTVRGVVEPKGLLVCIVFSFAAFQVTVVVNG